MEESYDFDDFDDVPQKQSNNKPSNLKNMQPNSGAAKNLQTAANKGVNKQVDPIKKAVNEMQSNINAAP